MRAMHGTVSIQNTGSNATLRSSSSVRRFLPLTAKDLILHLQERGVCVTIIRDSYRALPGSGMIGRAARFPEVGRLLH